MASSLHSPGCQHDPPGRSRTAPSPRGGHFRSLFEHAGICMVSVDANLIVREANPDFCRELGWANSTVRGRDVLQFVHRSGHARLREEFARVSSDDEHRVCERAHLVRANGTTLPGQFTAVAVNGREQADILVAVRHERAEPERRDPADRRTVLTPRDAQVLEAVAEGVSSAQIAAKLNLSRQGVEYHVSAMLRKLKVPNRAALVSRAYSMGILGVGTWPPQVRGKFVK